MYVVRMGVGEENAIDPVDSGVEGLVAKVGRRVDQDIHAVPFDEDGRPAPPVARIARIAISPAAADHRHALGASAAEYGDLHRPARAADFLNNRKKLSVVCWETASRSMSLTAAIAAAVWATKAGSLRFPRFGTGAR